ncbi:MAG: radical SAM protein [Deltaproteobacteria bacterium]|nr:radical SAM protein [Candidatus Anaeroferrophillus wilburensis]MBN2889863.1 radical SAM protein [Deltaproteobacteria bacterium]
MRLAEIFTSLQGESTFAGLPCVFVRCAGCNLCCSYCDTTYAREYAAGREMTIDEVVALVLAEEVPMVEITGGEPLLQPETPRLIDRLLAAGRKVLLETNGSQDISRIDQRVQIILDIKTPGSGMAECNRLENLSSLGDNCQVKFVLTDEDDFWWSRDFIRLHLSSVSEILFSPVHGLLAPRRLAELILQEQLPVRLQLQLHRLLWPGEERGR